MINNEKWIDSLPKINEQSNASESQINSKKWINTISKKNNYNSISKYSFVVVLFIIGLLLVSALKNETRNLEKEINILKASITIIKHNLNQAKLDHEVITSPENISRLAEEYLDNNFSFYKKSQMQNLNENTKNYALLNNKEEKKIKNKNLKKNIKFQVQKRIEQKKKELKKIQGLYENPKSIPDEIKTQVVKKVRNKKDELKNIYNSPSDTINLASLQRWGAVQLVKAFLGIPIVPGK